jgi:hypothetical protein
LVRDEQRASERRVVAESVVDGLSRAEAQSRQDARRPFCGLRASERERRSGRGRRDDRAARNDERQASAVSVSRDRRESEADTRDRDRDPRQPRKPREKARRISEVGCCDEWQLWSC